MSSEQRFHLELTPEEGILLLTGAKLLDKLVAGISFQARDRDELVKEIVSKLSDHLPAGLVGLSEEIAEAVVESVLGSVDFDDEFDEFEELADVPVLGDDDLPLNYPMYSVDRTLPALEEAVVKHRTVKAHYYSFQRESVDEITLDPLALVKEDGLWQMIAFCHERNEAMLFRVDRIKELAETAGRFEVPPGLNLKKQLPFAS
jgi:hypothetical protein